MPISERGATRLAAVFLATTILFAGLLAAAGYYIEELRTAVPPPAVLPAGPSRAPVSPLLLHYRLDLPGRGEVFPALSAGLAADYWPVAVLGISNTSDQATVQTVAADLPGWSQREIRTVTIAAHQDLKVNLSPPLLAAAFQNPEMRRVTLEVRATSPEVGTVFSQTRTVYLHGASDIYWGKKFANAQFVARWVTPHDPAVLDVVSRARKWMPAGRMPGYNTTHSAVPEAQVRAQAEAVFHALQQSGISYVSSIFTFGNYAGEAQRIRLPRETLSLANANCIDVSVVFASAMENLDMEPVIVIVPGHAFTGVRLGPQSPRILYLDLTVLPKGTFRQAEARAAYWRKKTPADQTLTVDVAAARTLGIYPM